MLHPLQWMSIGRYGDAVQEVDNVIGSIYAAVQKAGIADNTLTFFTAGKITKILRLLYSFY